MRKIYTVLGLTFILLLTLSCSKKSDNVPVNIPPNKPISLNGSSYTCEVLRPTLKWTCTDDDDDGLTYTLMFGNSSESLEVKASNLATDSFTFSEDLAKSTKYYWQIVVSDGKNETVGNVWEFSTISNPIVNTIPSTPIIISPKANTKTGNITFIWSVVVDDGGLENITYILNVNGIEY